MCLFSCHISFIYRCLLTVERWFVQKKKVERRVIKYSDSLLFVLASWIQDKNKCYLVTGCSYDHAFDKMVKSRSCRKFLENTETKGKVTTNLC